MPFVLFLLALIVSCGGPSKGNTVIAPILPVPPSPILLYSSTDLNGHSVVPECDPGSNTSCPCSAADVSLTPQTGFAEVRSNSNTANTWVNAVGFRRFTETWPSGSNITLGTYSYQYDIRLPVVPVANTAQTTNAEGSQVMIQLYDGRNVLWNAQKKTLEAAVYWNLNAWDSDYGKIQIYTGAGQVLQDTGLTIVPDLNWHTIRVLANFTTQKYISVTVDGQTVDASSFDLASVDRPAWGTEVSVGLTTESLATYPGGNNCPFAFTWTTQYRNLSFIKLP